MLVRNSGDRPGTEVVQAYNGELPAPVHTPPKQLLGWARVTLQPGEQQWVDMPVRVETAEHLLAYWRTNGWATPRGDVPILVGSSSEDIRLEGAMFVR